MNADVCDILFIQQTHFKCRALCRISLQAVEKYKDMLWGKNAFHHKMCFLLLMFLSHDVLGEKKLKRCKNWIYTSHWWTLILFSSDDEPVEDLNFGKNESCLNCPMSYSDMKLYVLVCFLDFIPGCGLTVFETCSREQYSEALCFDSNWMQF